MPNDKSVVYKIETGGGTEDAMTLTQKELGKRLRAAREACGLRQQDVAQRLAVSRSTVAQMELGNRPVTSVELDRLAYLYGRDVAEFFDPEFREDDALVAIFRRHPDASDQEQIADAVRQCLELGRELTNLERLLGLERDLGLLAEYPVPVPTSRWEAIEQGMRLAQEERRRLGLGIAPAPNLAELLETQGVRTAQADLPADVSGLTLFGPEIGILTVVNLTERYPYRRRFSYAHEYCHGLVDRQSKGTISRRSQHQDLLEVRANVFAANFLMPAEGVRQFVRRLAKGAPSRLRAEAFDGDDSIVAEARTEPGTQAIQLYDVVHLAHHFGVSRPAMIYRLQNLKLITEPQAETLRDQNDANLGKKLAEFLGLEEPDETKARNEFRHRFLNLALEAFRREEITKAKLVELAAMVDVQRSDLQEILDRTGLEREEPPPQGDAGRG